MRVEIDLHPKQRENPFPFYTASSLLMVMAVTVLLLGMWFIHLSGQVQERTERLAQAEQERALLQHELFAIEGGYHPDHPEWTNRHFIEQTSARYPYSLLELSQMAWEQLPRRAVLLSLEANASGPARLEVRVATKKDAADYLMALLDSPLTETAELASIIQQGDQIFVATYHVQPTVSEDVD